MLFLECIVIGSSFFQKNEKATKMIPRCHSFLFYRCHSLSLVVPLVDTACTIRCHLLSIAVVCCQSLHNSLSRDVSLVYFFINDRYYGSQQSSNLDTSRCLIVSGNGNIFNLSQNYRVNLLY